MVGMMAWWSVTLLLSVTCAILIGGLLREKGPAAALTTAGVLWFHIFGQIVAVSTRIGDELFFIEALVNIYEKNEPAHTLYKTFGFKEECAISNSRIRMKCNFRD